MLEMDQDNCAAMEMRLKSRGDHDPGIRWAGKNQGIHGKLRIKQSLWR